MSNMSYCRFRNTLLDLQDCAGAMEDLASEGKEIHDGLDPEEKRAQQRLIELCKDIVDNFGDE